MFHMAYILQINGEVSPHVWKHGNDIETLANILAWYCFLIVQAWEEALNMILFMALVLSY